MHFWRFLEMDGHLSLLIVSMLVCSLIGGWLALLCFQRSVQLEVVHGVLSDCEGGVFRQIDVHREVVEVLLQEAPDLLRRHRWLQDRLRGQDRFLVELASSIPVRNVVAEGGREYPRSWPVVAVSGPPGRLGRGIGAGGMALVKDGQDVGYVDGRTDWPAGFVQFS